MFAREDERTDPDFDSIRDDPRFAEIVGAPRTSDQSLRGDQA